MIRPLVTLRVLMPVLACLVFASPGPAAPAIPPKLPVSDFFSKPSITQLQFSPDGKFIAALMPKDRRLNLVVMDLEKRDKRFITGFTDFNVGQFTWANNDRLIMLMDDDGDEDAVAFSINRDGSDFRKHDKVYGLLGRDPNNPRRVAILTNETHRNRTDPAWFDLKTGKISLIAKNPGQVREWVLDRNFVARFGISGDVRDFRILYREKSGEDWREVGRLKDGEPGWTPLAFDGDNRHVFVASDIGRKTAAIYRMDTETMTLGDPIAEDPTYDLGEVTWSQGLKKVVGASYVADRERVLYWDDAFAARQKIIDQALPGNVNVQLEATEDGSKIIVVSRSDRDPGVYYLFDAARKKIEEIAIVMPKLDPEQMAPMKHVTYTARDGMLIHGYLTLPVGREPKGLPLVVNPHGGPFGPRDEWQFNPEVQLMANRGFAVLQPNFRGSGGYGMAYERAGYREWGGKMQDDLTDGVKWLVESGVVDPARVVIVGASYGGYAVMAGLTFTPEVYALGINYVGVTDLRRIALQRRGTDANKYWTRTRIGDADDDADFLKSRSPVHFADRIRVPVFMAYGRNDPRVTREHGDDMAAALKKHDKVFEYIIEDDEGHGFQKEERSIAFYTQVDTFLEKHLPPPGTPRVTLGEAQVLELPAKEKP
jgi:dipeptidyl aminopeptidase/acylaminoacyl peptidase